MYVLITSNPDCKGGAEGVASLNGKYGLKLPGKDRRSVQGVSMAPNESKVYNAITDCVNSGNIPADGCIGTTVCEETARRWYGCMKSFEFVGSVYLLSDDLKDQVLHTCWKK